MGLESNMWANLKRSIGKHWDATRHEDKYQTGVPDVSFGAKGINGWIELKALSKWPSDPQEIVKLKHYTKEQRLWIYLRGSYAGRVWLLLRVGSFWLLFDHTQAQKVGSLSKLKLLQNASKIFFKNPEPDEFIKAITQDQILKK